MQKGRRRTTAPAGRARTTRARAGRAVGWRAAGAGRRRVGLGRGGGCCGGVPQAERAVGRGGGELRALRREADRPDRTQVAWPGLGLGLGLGLGFGLGLGLGLGLGFGLGACESTWLATACTEACLKQ